MACPFPESLPPINCSEVGGGGDGRSCLRELDNARSGPLMLKGFRF